VTRDGLLSAAALHRLTPADMELYLRSSGYFRQKAKRVRFFLDAVRNEAGGSVTTFLSGPVPWVRERLSRLHGVGPETADSMLLYAAGKPVFVVDAYTRRIGGRWGLLRGNETYDDVKSRFEKALPRSTALFSEYHALLVALAKNHCRSQPRCEGCPARPRCAYGRRERRADVVPVSEWARGGSAKKEKP
jgi:endonuclease-3 related protein